MRRLPLTSAAMAEVFCYTRDRAKPTSQADLAHLISAREPMVPSKAHIAKIERHRNGRRFVDELRPYPVSDDVLKGRVQSDHFKRMIADLGGSRTIEPSPAGVLYNAEARGLLTIVKPVQNEEHTYPTQWEIMAAEDARIKAEGERLAADFARERAKVDTIFERFSRLSAGRFDDCGF